MTGILITFNLASAVFLVYVLIQGILMIDPSAIRFHIIMALSSTALCVFAHCLTMMYVVAVGRMIREAVEKKVLDQSYVSQTKSYRKSIFRAATIGMLSVMTQTILGGGVHTGLLSPAFHLALGLFAVSISGYATFLEIRYLIANHLLGHRVAHEYEKAG